LIKASDLRLRGADAIIAMVAVRAGLNVSIMRLAFVQYPEEGDIVVDELPTLQNVGELLGSKAEVIEDKFLALGINCEELTDFKKCAELFTRRYTMGRNFTSCKLY
jgi:hypothetical protein